MLPPVPVGPALVTQSVTFAPGIYDRPAAEGAWTKSGTEEVPTFPAPALEIRGDGITVDFKGAELRGTSLDVDPDARRGLAIRVRGNGVTIRNLRARGYRVAILAEECKNLRIENCDLSDNWKPRLYSTEDKEDLRDWMSFHRNEGNEWLRYGAAVYLDRCLAPVVKRLKVRRGANGLLMNRTSYGSVRGCDISFNSAVGLGMYRSSDNVVEGNRLDYNVRGFSYGVYNRGQDSAAILLFEDCDRNVFRRNFATHSGDGFFLWAGQSTMDTGLGGCDLNVVEWNDFSHAPTNGIEATFSRNFFRYNRVVGCAHGVWGGYSKQSEILGNLFAENRAAIAIEHGFGNSIVGNVFSRDDVAISLWANQKQDPSWEYPKVNDTRSREYFISGNRGENVGVFIDLRRTTDVLADYRDTDGPIRLDAFSALQREPTPEGDLTATAVRRWGTDWRNGAGGGSMRFAREPDAPGEGWRTIYVGEWGPYDFRRPLLARERIAGVPAPAPGANSAPSSGRAVPKKPEPTGWYDVLGPKGTWRVVASEGYKLSAREGTVPGHLKLDPLPGFAGSARVELAYVGEETIDERGRVTPKGEPVLFGRREDLFRTDWTVRFHPWTASVDPNDVHAVPADPFSAAPVATIKTDRLDFAGYGKFAPNVPATKFATVAETTLTLKPGEWVFSLTTDDGARLFVDDRLVWESWKYQGPTGYEIPWTSDGKPHRVRVEHFQIDGYAALSLKVRRK